MEQVPEVLQYTGVLPNPDAGLNWDDYHGAIHEVFASNAKRWPDRPCVIETQGRLVAERVFTYRQINESSNQLAHFLLAHGCERGDVVMIYAHRGVELVIAYMGTLKAGATATVLDPIYPPDRQKILIEVASPRFLIQIRRASEAAGNLSDMIDDFVHNHMKLKAEIPALEFDGTMLKGGTLQDQDCLLPYVSLSDVLPNIVVGPDSIPTLSFTSGSEGKPKAVQGRHFSLTHYFPWMAQRFGLSENDRFTMLSGIAHDPIQRDIFTPLFLGAQLICPPPDVISHELLAEWMSSNLITVTHLTPAMGQVLVGGARVQVPTLHHAFFVGDLLTKKDCRNLQKLAPLVQIVNMYGTTETQRAVSFFELPSRHDEPEYLDTLPDIIPVGQGMVNVQLLVVDRNDRNRICEVGEQGELFLRAGGLAEGYRGDDDVTRELNDSKFLINWLTDSTRWKEAYERKASTSKKPWMEFYKGPRDRVYRTGDLGRFRDDGAVECTGRVDHQVKIRGFRIELGDVDTQLSSHPFVRENLTIIRRNEQGEPHLISYIVPETTKWLQMMATNGTPVQGPPDESLESMTKTFRPLTDDSKRYLTTKLPQYAVPTAIVPLARMPLNPNGKIDRPALPAPIKEALLATESVNVLLTDTQQRLAELWAAILPDRIAAAFTPNSNFFEEGGHSILAQKLVFQIRREWANIHVSIHKITQSTSLLDMALHIDKARGCDDSLETTVTDSIGGEVNEDVYAADADELVRQLPSSISTAVMHDGPKTVFVTGATGFLGCYVVHEFLRLGIRAFVHVRSKDPETGRARMEASARTFGLDADLFSSHQHLRVITGDITKSRLGMSASDWDDVARDADTVVHIAAEVNWVLPYSNLRKANVLSTVDCINLCAEQTPKRIIFVSSTSTLDTDYYVGLSRDAVSDGGAGVLEADSLEGSRRGLQTGYGQSKWVSEHVVRAAGTRGLRGAIIRPGYIMGDRESGITITDNFLVRMWKGCVQINARPRISNTLNQVPVTQVSNIVVAATLNPPSDSEVKIVHVTSHPRLTMDDWLGALSVYGYDVPQVDYAEWRSKLGEYVDSEADREEHALLPLLHFVMGDLPSESVSPELDDATALQVLRASRGINGNHTDMFACHNVDVHTMGMYLAYLVHIGFLPAPAGNSERKLPGHSFKSIR